MFISVIIICVIFFVFMIIFIYLRRYDWYLLLFPMIILSGICVALSLISDKLSIIFSLMVCGYIINGLTNKRAKQIKTETELERKHIFEEYKKDCVNNQSTYKNYVLPSGRKVDYIDFDSRTFYLLRPYNDNLEKRYKKQLKRYLYELETTFGGTWNYVIDTY